jgi:hypothetical protein
MAINTPVYCTRSQVRNAQDVRDTALRNAMVDDSIQSAARSIEGALNRKFYPQDGTRYKDWPERSYPTPWRIWLDADELAGQPTAVTAGGVAIPIGNIFAEPANLGPPFTRIEVNRGTSSAFSSSTTPQRAIAITGPFGFSADTDPAGSLAAAITDTTGTSVTVSDSSKVDAGNIIYADTERMLVTDTALVTSTQTQQGSGCSTTSASDNLLTVTDGTKFSVGETVTLDGESMFVYQIAGNILTVKRAWNGSVLATHSGATIFVPRLLTVQRGALGSTAATHLISAAVKTHRWPALVNELAVAEAVNAILQKTSGYARTVGEGDNLRNASGAGLNDIRMRTMAAYGRKSRSRVI